MKLLKSVFGWVGSIAVSFLLVLLIGVFVFQPTKVEGHSMDPTLHDTQRIYISKLIHTFSSAPDYGDIVIIDSRTDRKRTLKDDVLETPFVGLLSGKKDDRHIWVKRVIGKPGDTLEFRDHQVFRNGQPMDEPYLNEQMAYQSDQKIVVPDGHIFVMGDNRNHSNDSRAIGAVPLDHVLGKKM